MGDANTPPPPLISLTGDSARYRTKPILDYARFFNVLDVYNCHTGPRFNVSFERLLVILVCQPGTRTYILCSDTKHCVHESNALLTELYRLIVCPSNLLPTLLFVCLCICFWQKCQPPPPHTHTHKNGWIAWIAIHVHLCIQHEFIFVIYK